MYQSFEQNGYLQGTPLQTPTQQLDYIISTEVPSYLCKLHSQFMTKIQIGHSDKSWSNLGRLTFDQDFMS